MNQIIVPSINFKYWAIRLSLILIIFMVLLRRDFFMVEVFFTCLAMLSFLFFIITRIYKSMTYEITPSTIKYKREFLGLSRKDLPFKNIKEVKLGIGPIERFFNLGTIKIHTGATSSDKSDITGITLSHIENPEQVYETIQNYLAEKD